MSEFQGEMVLVDVLELLPNPNNAKLHTKKQIDVLVRSMKRVGFNDPIHITEDNVILAGHGRLQAAKKLGLVKVPCLRFSHLTEDEKRAYTLSHNQIGNMTGYDETLLSIEVEALKDADFELDLLGFDTKMIDDLLGMEEIDVTDDLGDAATDLPGIVQLSNAMVLPDDQIVDPYGIPALRDDRLGDFEEEPTVWIGRNRTTDNGGPLFYLYGSDSTIGMDATRTTIAFYVDDVRFERVWNDLPGWTTKFISAGVRQVIMPNYSILRGMPNAVAIYQTYRCKYIARYFQEAGLNVIPDLQVSRDQFDVDYMMAGIPEGCPCVAAQMQAFDSRDEETDTDARGGLAVALDLLKPRKLLMYAGAPGIRLGKEAAERAGIEYIGVLNRAAHMRADVAKHEDVRAF